MAAFCSCEGKRADISKGTNTVRKYVAELEGRYLICTKPTSIVTRDDCKRNGTLLYNMCLIQEAVDSFCEQQTQKLRKSVE